MSPVRFCYVHEKDLDRLPYTPEITDFLNENRFRWTDATFSSYDVTLRRLVSDLRSAGFPADPRSIGKKEVNYLLSIWDGKMKMSTQRNMLRILSSFCGHFDNHFLPKMHILFEANEPSRADWLTGDQLNKLISALTEPQLVCATIMCSYGMLRRVDAMRIRMCDIDLPHGQVVIHGKGHRGGKIRILVLTPVLKTALVRWLDKRNRIIRRFLDRFPDAFPRVPDTLFLWEDTAHKIGAMKEGSWDNNIKVPLQRTAQSLGFPLGGSHTLRRTGARLCYKAGMPLAEIQLALGHSTAEMTEHYLGLGPDDLMDSMTLAQQKMMEQYGNPLHYRESA